MRRSLTKLGWALPVMALIAVAMAAPAQALEVQVGYADNLRPSPFFPSPFFGDASVQLFAGQNPNAFALDSGAVRLHNDGASPVTITSVVVHMRNGAGTLYDLWSSLLPVTLLPGKDAIFVQTAQFNFDSSDPDQLLAINGQAGNTVNNCSVGPNSLTSICTNNPAQVIVNGTILLDTGHVLDTGGFDSVAANPCPNPTEPSGSCNESLQWRDIGTCGLNCPGGNVPEPPSLVLLGSAVAAVAAFSVKARVMKRMWHWSAPRA